MSLASGVVLGIHPTKTMKKPLSPVVLGLVGVAALALLVFFFMKGTGEPAPTATNLPDYSKMTPEQIAQQKTASMDSERQNARPK